MKNNLLWKWLAGTTCNNAKYGHHILFENEGYIVFKHNSHASYCGRMLGSQTCRVYAKLYRKADLVLDATGYNQNLFLGSGALMQWDGRINTVKVIEDCRQMGVTF